MKSVEAGRTVRDVCREAAISEASYYNGKAKQGGMEASGIKKIKDLEDESRRFRQMFADLTYANRVLGDVIEKNVKTSDKAPACQLADDAVYDEHTPGMQDVIAEQKGVRYQPDMQRNQAVILKLAEAAERYPRCGFKKLFQLLHRRDYVSNCKRVHRIYRLLKLNFVARESRGCRCAIRLRRHLTKAARFILCTMS